MPKKGQTSITLNDKITNVIGPIADKNGRSVAGLVKLCIEYQFGDKAKKTKAKNILENLVK